MIDGRKLVSRPDPTATGIWIMGLMVSYLFVSGQTPTQVASRGAILLAGIFALSTGVEIWRNWKAILRPDIVAFAALYALTFLEFLLPQPAVNSMLSADSMHRAVGLGYLAFGAMAIGRHMAPPASKYLEGLVQRPTPPRVLLTVFWISFILGTLYMFLAVSFNPIAVIDRSMGPRFSQPWGRGRFGDWRALLNEIGAVINLLPPVAGLILSDREKYRPITRLLVVLVYAFVLFLGLSSSTRNVLAAYIITFLVAYSLNLTRKRYVEFAVLCLLALTGFYAANKIMLETRTIGLKNYIALHLHSSSAPTLALTPPEKESIFIDLNLVNIGLLTDVFPRAHHFLGLEVPYVALTHPIPRAIWKGKPEGLSVSLEEALGVGPEMTIAASFIGESYMAGGAFAVALTGLFFGMLTGWWARFTVGLSSGLGLLIYASGFLAIGISMRSLYVLSVAALPTVAAVVLAMLLTRRPIEKRRVEPAWVEVSSRKSYASDLPTRKATANPWSGHSNESSGGQFRPSDPTD
jgi:hypothetical protein